MEFLLSVGGGVRMERLDTIRVGLMSWVLARCLVDLASEKGFSGVEDDAFDVEEFCLLICSGKVLFIPLRSIACGCRTLGPFNCCLKLRYLSCNWKYLSAFTSLLRSVRERTSSILSCTSCIARRSGPVDRFCCFRYRTISFKILPCVSAWLNPSSLGSTFVRSIKSLSSNLFCTYFIQHALLADVLRVIIKSNFISSLMILNYTVSFLLKMTWN